MEDSDQDAGETGPFGRSPEGACRVILWDQRQSDCQKIIKITKSAGAHPVLVQNLADLRFVQCCAQCCVAVAVTGPLPGVGMQAIHDLKAKGFKVIACEEGTGYWPIKTKCLPLLAGAVQLPFAALQLMASEVFGLLGLKWFKMLNASNLKLNTLGLSLELKLMSFWIPMSKFSTPGP